MQSITTKRLLRGCIEHVQSTLEHSNVNSRRPPLRIFQPSKPNSFVVVNFKFCNDLRRRTAGSIVQRRTMSTNETSTTNVPTTSGDNKPIIQPPPSLRRMLSFNIGLRSLIGATWVFTKSVVLWGVIGTMGGVAAVYGLAVIAGISLHTAVSFFALPWSIILPATCAGFGAMLGSTLGSLNAIRYLLINKKAIAVPFNALIDTFFEQTKRVTHADAANVTVPIEKLISIVHSTTRGWRDMVAQRAWPIRFAVGISTGRLEAALDALFEDSTGDTRDMTLDDVFKVTLLRKFERLLTSTIDDLKLKAFLLYMGTNMAAISLFLIYVVGARYIM